MSGPQITLINRFRRVNRLAFSVIVIDIIFNLFSYEIDISILIGEI